MSNLIEKNINLSKNNFISLSENNKKLYTQYKNTYVLKTFYNLKNLKNIINKNKFNSPMEKYYDIHQYKLKNNIQNKKSQILKILQDKILENNYISSENYSYLTNKQTNLYTTNPNNTNNTNNTNNPNKKYIKKKLLQNKILEKNKINNSEYYLLNESQKKLFEGRNHQQLAKNYKHYIKKSSIINQILQKNEISQSEYNKLSQEDKNKYNKHTRQIKNGIQSYSSEIYYIKKTFL